MGVPRLSRVARRALKVAEPAPDQVSAAASGPDMSPLPGLVSYTLRRTHAAVFARFRRRFSDLDISPVQLGILTVVHNNPGLNQAAVSAALGIKRANLVPLLDGLAQRGLIERLRVASDRRAHALHATRAGADLLAELQRREQAFEAEITALIGAAGKRQLVALLEHVGAALQDEQDGEEG